MELKQHLFVVGFNHNTAPVEVRERHYLDTDMFAHAMSLLADFYQVKEYFLISTCNRLELTALTQHKLDDESVYDLFRNLTTRAAGHDKPAGLLTRNHVYIHHHDQAVSHVFAVCSGLDSLVLGETQIIGQFKEAIARAKERGWMGTILDRLTQEALATAKKVRSCTDIGRGMVSISHMAIHMANLAAGDLSGLSFALIGAGEMSQVAAQYLTRYQPLHLEVLNRTLSKAQGLVECVGIGVARPLDELKDALVQSDVVICSTRSSDYLITAAMIENVQKDRDHRPLYLIDISLPRNIDPAVTQAHGVQLFGIDDIKLIVSQHIEERKIAAQKARGIIAFCKWIHSTSVAPLLSQFRNYIDTLLESELQKTLGRQSMSALSEQQVEEVKNLMNSVAKKLTIDAALKVTNPPHGVYQHQLANALKIIFLDKNDHMESCK
jgi:glutamyl-tRNA reductase